MFKKRKRAILIWALIGLCLPLYHCGNSDGGQALFLPEKPMNTNNEESLLKPGDYDQSLIHDDILRQYLLHVPESYNGNSPRPLVINFHSLLGWPEGQAERSGWVEKSDELGFIVVHPAGTPFFPRSWNAQNCCANNKMDDVGFVRALVADVSAVLNINPNRIFATGLSNGASLSHRLACEAADLFKAIAPVSFGFNAGPDDCRPVKPIGVIGFHGTNDNVAQYDGSSLGLSAEESNAVWANINSCTEGPLVTSIGINGSFCETYSGCDDRVKVTMCTIIEGVHDLYDNRADVNIADMAWNYFF